MDGSKPAPAGMAEANFLPYRAKLVITIFLAIWFGWFFYHPIDLLPADLGRHIMNGAVLLSQPGNAAALLHTNFYSLPAPQSPFINHHWLTGVVFYLVWNYFGFVGLSLFQLFLSLVTFFLFFKLAAHRGGFAATALTAVFLIPIIAERTEIRPEIFTYFFSALYLTVLSGVAAGRSKPWRLLWLLPIQLFWVNFHIYFFLGPFFIGVYLICALFKNLTTPRLIKPLLLILFGSLGISLVNPSGLQGLLYPLLIFKQYDFHVSENQSIFYFESNKIYFTNLMLFKITAVIVWVHYFKLWLIDKKIFHLENILLLSFTTVWAAVAIRNFTIFAYTALLILPALLKANYDSTFFKKQADQFKYFCLAFFALLLLAISFSHGRLNSMASNLKLGLVPESTDAFDFIIQNRLDGPMFNDYDVGSAATFFLFPHIRPFVENRPEAYPPNFWQKEFLPAHTDAALWQTEEQKYHFNLIVFSLEDHAPWSKTFLETRLKDPTWVPIFKNDYVLVLAKRTSKNQAVINTYQIPPEKVVLPWNK